MMTIRRSLNGLLCVALVTMLGVGNFRAQTVNEAAQSASESWVALVDQAQYDASWQTAASGFKNAVTQQKWSDAVQAARGPLGALRSRTLKNRAATKTLPGAPDGDYVVMQFTTAFDKKAAALETITVVHEPDGQWRVVGYFVR